MRRILIFAALSLCACAEGYARRVALNDQVNARLGEKAPDGLKGQFMCETMTLVGTHLPKTYCTYRDLDAEDQARIQVQTNFSMPWERRCTGDQPSCRNN